MSLITMIFRQIKRLLPCPPGYCCQDDYPYGYIIEAHCPVHDTHDWLESIYNTRI
jgi:hypothetical protein